MVLFISLHLFFHPCPILVHYIHQNLWDISDSTSMAIGLILLLIQLEIPYLRHLKGPAKLFMKKIVIAIDGFSGCGKSTTAKEVAKILGYTYIDSGAMYRAVTLHFLNRFTNLTNPREVDKSLQTFKVEFHKDAVTGDQLTFLNGLNVEKEIRSMRVSEMVSEVSKIKAVRTELVAQQKRLGRHKAVVMDGRDIGTVVFPDAELKVFMTADINIRAARRQQEILEKGQLVRLEDVIRNLTERDRIDSTRVESPLVKAEDALEVDTSYLSFEEQVSTIVDMAKQKIAA